MSEEYAAKVQRARIGQALADEVSLHGTKESARDAKGEIYLRPVSLEVHNPRISRPVRHKGLPWKQSTMRKELTMIIGTVDSDGSIIAGDGFTVDPLDPDDPGRYTLNFESPVSQGILVNTRFVKGAYVNPFKWTSSDCTFVIRDVNGNPTNTNFAFLADTGRFRLPHLGEPPNALQMIDRGSRLVR